MADSVFASPSIDSFATARKLAPVMMNNIVQQIQLKDGRGVTEKFSQDVLMVRLGVLLLQ